MDESTADKIVKSLLDYRGESMIEDWTGTIVPIEVEYLKNTINEDSKGEVVGIPKLITALLGDNSQVQFVDGLNENVWNKEDEVTELTGVPKQLDWLASLDDMKPNDFSVVALAKDRDGIAPMLAWFVYKPNYGDDVVWKKLGVLSNYWSMFENYGVFSNRASEGDFMYEDADSRDDDWWNRQLRPFIKALEEEAGVIAFTVDFKGMGPQIFVRVLNWKDWPEALL